MIIYQKLQEINDRLSKVNTDFAKYAFDELCHLKIDEDLDDSTIFDTLFAQNLPPQFYSENNFGEFNVTLFNQNGVSIQIYVMNAISTEIHDHPFVGAYKILKGRSVAHDFSFVEKNEIENDVLEGKLVLEKSKLMTKNDVAIIQENKIHQLIRLEEKNITLVAIKNMNIRNAYYLYPSLKIKNHSLGATFLRRLSALGYLYEKNKLNFEKYVSIFLNDLKLKELLFIISKINGPISNTLALNVDRNSFNLCMYNKIQKLLESKYQLNHLISQHEKFLMNQEHKAKIL